MRVGHARSAGWAARAGSPLRATRCGSPAWTSPCTPATASAHPGTCRALIRPVMRASSGRRPGPAALGFLLPFSRRHSLPGHPVPPGASAPLTIGLSPRLHTRACTADPGEVYTFRTHETQTGRALSLPRGQRCSPAVATFAAVAIYGTRFRKPPSFIRGFVVLTWRQVIAASRSRPSSFRGCSVPDHGLVSPGSGATTAAAPYLG